MLQSSSYDNERTAEHSWSLPPSYIYKATPSASCALSSTALASRIDELILHIRESDGAKQPNLLLLPARSVSSVKYFRERVERAARGCLRTVSCALVVDAYQVLQYKKNSIACFGRTARLYKGLLAGASGRPREALSLSSRLRPRLCSTHSALGRRSAAVCRWISVSLKMRILRPRIKPLPLLAKETSSIAPELNRCTSWQKLMLSYSRRENSTRSHRGATASRVLIRRGLTASSLVHRRK